MANRIIPYNPHLKILARELRKNPTKSELILWQAIRRKVLGVEFHRQVPIDQFIVDFYCHELFLAIEVDGLYHEAPDQKAYDRVRQERLEDLGVRLVRFSANDVENNGSSVISKLRRKVNELILTTKPEAPTNKP